MQSVIKLFAVVVNVLAEFLLNKVKTKAQKIALIVSLFLFDFFVVIEIYGVSVYDMTFTEFWGVVLITGLFIAAVLFGAKILKGEK